MKTGTRSLFVAVCILLAGTGRLQAAPAPQLFGTFPGRDHIYSATNTQALVQEASAASAVNATNVSATALQSANAFSTELVRTNTIAQDARTQASLDAVNQSVSALSNNVSALSNNVSALSNNVSALSNNVSALANNVSALSNNVDMLGASVASVQTQTIAAVSGVVASHNNDPSAHSSYLATRTYVDNLVASVLVPPESAAAAYMAATNAQAMAAVGVAAYPLATNAQASAEATAGSLAAFMSWLNPTNMPSVRFLGTNTLSLGNGSLASAPGSAAFGIGAIASNIYAFVWNGIQSVFYGDRGPGTFNVNPVGGAAGFYIGSNSLASVVDAAVEPYKTPESLYGRVHWSEPLTVRMFASDIGVLRFSDMSGTYNPDYIFNLRLMQSAYDTATQGVAMAQIALDRPTGTDTGAVIGVVGSVLSTNKVHRLWSPGGSSLRVEDFNRLVFETSATPVCGFVLLEAASVVVMDPETEEETTVTLPEGTYTSPGTDLAWALGERPVGTSSGWYTMPLSPELFPSLAVDLRITRLADGIIADYSLYFIPYDEKIEFGGDSLIIPGTNPPPETIWTSLNLVGFRTNLVTSATTSSYDLADFSSSLGALSGTQAVHAASIDALNQTNNATSQVISGLFQSNAVVHVTLAGLAQTQQQHTVQIAGVSNLAQAAYDKPADTNTVNDLAGVLVSNHNASDVAHSDIRASVSNAVDLAETAVRTNSSHNIQIGTESFALANYSFAFGYLVTASGVGSRAFGYNSLASGHYSVAEGSGCTASGTGSMAFGQMTTASAGFATAFGRSTVASGAYSLAIGAQAIASDFCSFVWNGYGEEPSDYSSHGENTFNINPVSGPSGFYIGETNLQFYLDERLSVDHENEASAHNGRITALENRPDVAAHRAEAIPHTNSVAWYLRDLGTNGLLVVVASNSVFSVFQVKE